MVNFEVIIFKWRILPKKILITKKSFNLIFFFFVKFLDEFHSHKHKTISVEPFVFHEQEKTSEYWNNQGQETLRNLIDKKLNTNNAKNIIMFLGDGMSFSTVAATRMYMGGEEKKLSFEKFEYSGFSKVKKNLFLIRLKFLIIFYIDLLCRCSSSRFGMYIYSLS